MAAPYVVEWSEHVAALTAAAQDGRKWYAAVAATLLRPGDRVAVDIGCGGGGMTLALAGALGEAGQVVAVDVSPDLLASLAGKVRSRGGLAAVELVEADLGAGVEPVQAAAAGPVDLVWAAHSLHHVGDQQGAIDALVSLLAPGGRLALAEGGLPARHLPWDLGIGEPGLELRLEAANDIWFARMRSALPGHTTMPYGWTEALRRAGLSEVTTRTFLRESPVPLSEQERARVVDRFQHWLERLRPTGLLSSMDLAAWGRLLDPADPAWLGNRNDLHRLSADSVQVGIRDAGPTSGPTEPTETHKGPEPKSS